MADEFSPVGLLPRKAGNTHKGIDAFISRFVQKARPAKKDAAYMLNVEDLPADMLGRTTVDELKKNPRNLQVRIGVAVSHRWPNQDVLGTKIRDNKLFLIWLADETAISAIIPLENTGASKPNDSGGSESPKAKSPTKK